MRSLSNNREWNNKQIPRHFDVFLSTIENHFTDKLKDFRVTKIGRTFSKAHVAAPTCLGCHSANIGAMVNRPRAVGVFDGFCGYLGTWIFNYCSTFCHLLSGHNVSFTLIIFDILRCIYADSDFLRSLELYKTCAHLCPGTRVLTCFPGFWLQDAQSGKTPIVGNYSHLDKNCSKNMSLSNEQFVYVFFVSSEYTGISLYLYGIVYSYIIDNNISSYVNNRNCSWRWWNLLLWMHHGFSIETQRGVNPLQRPSAAPRDDMQCAHPEAFWKIRRSSVGPCGWGHWKIFSAAPKKEDPMGF